jgi:endo-1,3-1,4-beta-glycanase ExoK
MTSRWQGRVLAGLTATLAFACGSSLDSPASDAVLTAVAEEPAPQASASTANTGKPAGDAFLMDLSRGHDEDTQYLADYEMNENWIKIAFRPRNITFGKDGMTLVLQKTPGTLPFAGAEFQRYGNYGYGRYEAVLKSSDGPGAVSSFFTHTDGYFDDPHDEIDFEFVAATPHHVHLNYFKDGKDDPVDIPLGFNASQAEHLYAFEWAPDAIRWYIDGAKVHEVNAATAKVPIPTTSGRVIANLWAGSGDATGWTGEARFTRTTALYRCISHVPMGKAGAQCSDTFTPPPRP